MKRTLAGTLPSLCLVLAACATPPSPPPPAPAAWKEVPPVVGVALGGGGARGFAEVGVLRVLEQERIPVDRVAGTSVGALIGALYADSGSVVDLEFTSVQVTAEDIFDRSTLAFFSGGFVKGERIEAFLDARLKHKTIEGFAVPYAAVAVDLRTGETVAFRQGPAARAVHASAAIPGVFVPVSIDGRVFVDGGVTAPVPVDAVRAMGAEVVIAVSIPAGVPARAPSNPFEVAIQAAAIMASEVGRCTLQRADVVITPEVAGVAYDDFTQKKRLFEAGMAAARAALPAIRSAIAAQTRRVPVPAP
jgi:NTE family protein